MKYLSTLLIIVFILSACTTPATGEIQQNSMLRVVATTTIVADVVQQIGGERIVLDTLIPVGASPHAFDPTPQGIAKVVEADIVFANGAGLEEFLEEMIQNAGGDAIVMHVSEGIDFLQFNPGEEDHEQDANDSAQEEAGEHDHEGVDPHVWFDPNNVIVWVGNIQAQLSQLDPENADFYVANAEDYVGQLQDLDQWIRDQVLEIPVEDRLLVTDHQALSYFADEYGFTQVGAVIPAYSDLAQASAQELANLENAVRELGVKAILVGNTINPELADQVAADTGTKIVMFYTGSLTESDGDAPDYISFMKYNVLNISEAIK
ncbi:MAG: zinc ABC transporter substrate-binding protein [Anaerolineales bacterium]|nr:zinc ABC transporter substrate-binding protein [Anaerolineales bacterium]